MFWTEYGALEYFMVNGKFDFEATPCERVIDNSFEISIVSLENIFCNQRN